MRPGCRRRDFALLAQRRIDDILFFQRMLAECILDLGQLIYELENMPKQGPAFLAKLREFRAMLEAHIREEEDEVFPALKARLSKEENGKLTWAMNREGLKLA